MKISVKGIYSTGLIRFLSEKGYTLTKLSEKQKERFKIENEAEPDITIRDLKDKTGISILGKNVEKLIEDLKQTFWDSFFLKVEEKSVKEGKYVKIIEKGIEFEDLSEERKLEILQAITSLLDNTFGIYFKKTCQEAKIEEIINELKELLEKPCEKIEKWYVYFGYNSKRMLDEYRNKVLPTLENHHVYRKDLSDILDFAEILIQEVDQNMVLKNLKKYIIEKIKDNGIIYRYHRRPDGSYLKYMEVVKEVSLIDNKIYLKTIRIPKPGGTYDGLNKPKETGDYIITEYLEGEWYFKIEYYDKNGNLKGRYININTPIEITNKCIQYLDLAIDVIEVDNKKFIVDKEELEEYYKKGIITEKLYKKALEIANRLLE